jgi:hypothetical protein
MLHERSMKLRYTYIAWLVSNHSVSKKNFIFFRVTLNVIQSNCYSPSAIIVTSLPDGGRRLRIWHYNSGWDKNYSICQAGSGVPGASSEEGFCL